MDIVRKLLWKFCWWKSFVTESWVSPIGSTLKNPDLWELPIGKYYNLSSDPKDIIILVGPIGYRHDHRFFFLPLLFSFSSFYHLERLNIDQHWKKTTFMSLEPESHGLPSIPKSQEEKLKIITFWFNGHGRYKSRFFKDNVWDAHLMKDYIFESQRAKPNTSHL